MNQDFTVKKKSNIDRKKNSCRGVHLKKRFLHKQWAKKKKFVQAENSPPPPPPHHFSNGPSLRGIYSYLFFYKINKGDLPLMYSCVFCCEFIDFVGVFFGCYCLTPVTLFIIRCKGSTEKQPVVRTLSTRRRFADRKPIDQRKTSIIATPQ